MQHDMLQRSMTRCNAARHAATQHDGSRPAHAPVLIVASCAEIHPSGFLAPSKCHMHAVVWMKKMKMRITRANLMAASAPRGNISPHPSERLDRCRCTNRR